MEKYTGLLLIISTVVGGWLYFTWLDIKEVETELESKGEDSTAVKKTLLKFIVVRLLITLVVGVVAFLLGRKIGKGKV